VIKRPEARMATTDYQYCEPASIKFSSVSESEDPLTYYWNFSNDKTSTLKEPEIIFNKAGTYYAQLTIYSKGTCNDTSYSAVNTVSVFPVPVSAFSLTPAQTSVFDPIITIKSHASDAIHYSYTFGDGTSGQFANGYHIYHDPGNYVITQYVTNAYDCIDSSSQVVTILPEYRFWIPDAFSPDGNDVNEVFMPIAIGVDKYEFEIFDRWGTRLFKTSDPMEGWNGTYRGQVCKQDVYIWRITFRNVIDGRRELRCGHVTLIKSL
jgi:gliding motility-associated-like protein